MGNNKQRYRYLHDRLVHLFQPLVDRAFRLVFHVFYQNRRWRYMSNREILFRGKRLDNGEWFSSGNLIHFNDEDSPFFIPQLNAECMCEHNSSDNITLLENCVFYKVDPVTVGQSTAMKCNNGNRIFEDDILRFMLYGHSYTGVVTYKKGAFIVVCTQPLQYSFCMAATVSLEEAIRYGAVVIGNVHDNQELFEVAEA